MRHILCLLGLHNYSKPHYTDHFSSNVLDYRQKCGRCGHIITWTQPKGIDYKYYPVYWGKRKVGVYIVLVILVLIAVVLLFKLS
ncbi:hypothetical protein JXC34_01225 [Candidatus Woesearchaeota archaeon]|nr:hypothetical protein [Candidatus Woesearchaeota archaeon]